MLLFMVVYSGVLVCTDVMARGVDIPNIHYVLQYDPPSQARSVSLTSVSPYQVLYLDTLL